MHQAGGWLAKEEARLRIGLSKNQIFFSQLVQSVQGLPCQVFTVLRCSCFLVFFGFLLLFYIYFTEISDFVRAIKVSFEPKKTSRQEGNSALSSVGFQTLQRSFQENIKGRGRGL